MSRLPPFLASPASRTISLVFALNGFLFAGWFSRIPAVKEKLALSDAGLGLVLLGVPAGAIVFMLLTGWLIGRLSAARVTLLAATGMCLALPLPALAVDGPTLLLALAVLGMANGAMDVAMNAEAALVEQSIGRAVMVSFHAMFSLGGVAGALVGAAMAEVLGVLPHLALAGAVGLAVLAWRWRTLPFGPPTSESGPILALPHGPLLPIAAVAFATMLAEGSAADWGAVYIAQTLSGTQVSAALGYAGFATGMTLGRLLGDRLGEWLGEVTLVRGGAALAGVALGAALALHAVPIAILGLSVLGFGVAAIVPICLRRAAAMPGFSPGHALAGVATLAYTGFLAGPPLIGIVAEHSGLGLALGMVSLLLLVVALATGAALGVRSAPSASPGPVADVPRI